MFKRLIVVASFLLLAGLSVPAVSYAQETTTTCTTVTQYGGSVSYICGAETHVPVNTGVGDNMALVGGLILLSSAFLLFLSKKAQKVNLDRSL